MVYITGDTHGTQNISKLKKKNFKKYSRMTEDDLVIICGDSGICWNEGIHDRIRLKTYDSFPWTTAFVDGNHDNHEILSSLPVEIMNKGKIHRISDKVIHLMRGQIYKIEGKTFFTFGGASSIDKNTRTPGVSWWEQEEPSWAECETGLSALADAGWKVDYIITHAAPEDFVRKAIGPVKNEMYRKFDLPKSFCTYGSMTEKYLQCIWEQTEFRQWFFGHYHLDRRFPDQKLNALFQSVIELSEKYPIVNQPGLLKKETQKYM